MVDFCETKRDKAALLVLVDTGVRAEEFYTCNVSDLDLSRSKIHVYGKGHNGTKKERDVFMGKRARTALRAYLKERNPRRTDPLFANYDGERMSYYTLRQLIRRRAKDAGLDYVPSPHDFRRTFAIECLRNGADVVSLQRLLGHSTPTVVLRYVAQNSDDLQQAHRRISPLDNL